MLERKFSEQGRLIMSLNDRLGKINSKSRECVLPRAQQATPQPKRAGSFFPPVKGGQV